MGSPYSTPPPTVTKPMVENAKKKWDVICRRPMSTILPQKVPFLKQSHQGKFYPVKF